MLLNNIIINIILYIAETRKGMRKWNKNFSILEIGKNWFYEEIEKRWTLKLMRGWETKMIRDVLGLKKLSNKLAENWNAHCVDSWCMAFDAVGGMKINRDMLLLNPINHIRRKLHHQVLKKGGIRKSYNTPANILKGALVKHLGELFTVGGKDVGRNGIKLNYMIDIHDRDNIRSVVSRKVHIINEYNKWRFSYV